MYVCSHYLTTVTFNTYSRTNLIRSPSWLVSSSFWLVVAIASLATYVLNRSAQVKVAALCALAGCAISFLVYCFAMAIIYATFKAQQ
jgi:cation transporter-like permease